MLIRSHRVQRSKYPIAIHIQSLLVPPEDRTTREQSWGGVWHDSMTCKRSGECCSEIKRTPGKNLSEHCNQISAVCKKNKKKQTKTTTSINWNGVKLIYQESVYAPVKGKEELCKVVTAPSATMC